MSSLSVLNHAQIKGCSPWRKCNLINAVVSCVHPHYLVMTSGNCLCLQSSETLLFQFEMDMFSEFWIPFIFNWWVLSDSRGKDSSWSLKLKLFLCGSNSTMKQPLHNAARRLWSFSKMFQSNCLLLNNNNNKITNPFSPCQAATLHFK